MTNALITPFRKVFDLADDVSEIRLRHIPSQRHIHFEFAADKLIARSIAAPSIEFMLNPSGMIKVGVKNEHGADVNLLADNWGQLATLLKKVSAKGLSGPVLWLMHQLDEDPEHEHAFTLFAQRDGEGNWHRQ